MILKALFPITISLGVNRNLKISLKKTTIRDLVIVATVIAILLAVKLTSDVAQDPLDATEVDQFAEVGLARPEHVREIAVALCKVEYSEFPAELSTRFGNALVDGLKSKSKMPIPSIEFQSDLWGRGLFDRKNWKIVLDANLMSNTHPSQRKWIGILRTLVHELRHAEQRYLAARFHAAEGTSKRNRYAYMQLPDVVVEHALSDPSQVGSDQFEFGEYVSEMVHDQGHILHKRYIKRKIGNGETWGEESKRFNELYDQELPLERDAEAFENVFEHHIEGCLTEKRRLSG